MVDFIEQLDKIKQEYLNDRCTDCKERSRPVEWTSVTNGVFLCAECVKLHQTCLQTKISWVRPLDSDFWNHDQIGTLEVGGNAKFEQFISKYVTDPEEPRQRD